jgi:hypothetical protein
VPDGLVITAGYTFSVKSFNDTSAAALADGSATKGDIGVGAAVAVNRAHVYNEAYVGDATLRADGITILASETTSEFTFNSTDDVDDFRREFTFDPTVAVSPIAGQETIIIGTGHGLETGDMVIYKKGADENKVVGGLSDGTVYYVILDGTGMVKLAKTLDDAEAGKPIDLNLDETTGTDHKLVHFHEVIDLGEEHGLKTGDLVVYQKGGGDAVGGLQDGEVYYVYVDKGEKNKVRLAKSTADAAAVKVVDLTRVSEDGSEHKLLRVSTFMAEATSGAGGKDVGVAGSLGLNIVDKFTHAEIRTGASINADGTDPDEEGSTISIEANNSVINIATANATISGKSDVGVGLSVALNLADTATTALVQDSVSLANVNSLDFAATTSPTTRTKAEAGASGQDVSIGGAVAITLADTVTTARLGTGSAIAIDGTLDLVATERNGTVLTTADGVAAGKDVGVGAAVALALTSDEAFALSERSVTAAGIDRSTIEASTVARVETNAKAGAKGVKQESGARGGRNRNGKCPAGRAEDPCQEHGDRQQQQCRQGRRLGRQRRCEH